jgi:glycosyltransferase involved in cell wall biosynthesis
MTNRPAVLVAARPFDLSDAPYDAFVERHRRMVELLCDHFTVSLLGLRGIADRAPIAPRWTHLPYSEVSIGDTGRSRTQRLVSAWRVGRDQDITAEQMAIEAAARLRTPDAIVTVGPWLDRVYRPLHAVRPSVHLFEENLSQMMELAPQSLQARALRHIEISLASRSRRQPGTVCYIARSEDQAARRRYPLAKAVYLPYTLDPDQWPTAALPVAGTGAIVVGNMSQLRNAAGLADLCSLVAHRPNHPLWGTRVISDGGLHPMLAPFVASGMLVPTDGRDPAAGYRSAALAIVPAQRVSGLKTTVLQAWSTGCPVVGYTATANSVGADQTCMRFGSTAVELLAHLDDLFASPAERDALAMGGFARLRKCYDDDRNRTTFLSLVRHAARPDQPNMFVPVSTRS